MPEPPLRGFDTASSALGTRPVEELVRDLGRAKELGANAVRFALPWYWLEPYRPTMDPGRAAQVDRLLAAAEQQDLAVILTLLFTPCWASSASPSDSSCDPATAALAPPADPATYGGFVERVVRRWGQGLGGLEVWNEPNHASFWSGTPYDYVELARVAAETVRSSAYADLPVAGGALSGADLGYLRQLFDAGLSEWTDAISIHPYDARWDGPGFGDPSIPRPNDLSSFAYAVPRVHALMGDYGNADPIWITEFGYADCPATPFCVPPEIKAAYLRKAATLASGWQFVDVFLVYRLRDWLPQDGGMEARFGVLDRDGRPKPSARSLADAFASASAR